jgi:hypothetical protein
MKTLQQAVDAVTAKVVKAEGLDPEAQKLLNARLTKYDPIISELQHMRSTRDMLENMWQAMIRRQVQPKDAFFSLLANGVLIGLEMANAPIEDKPLVEIVQ